METLKRLPRWGVYALLAYAPFHIFLSTWLGTSLGGLEAWKIAKDFFAIALLLLTAGLVLLTVKRKAWQSYLPLIVLAALYAFLHLILYLMNKDTPLDIAALASTYNNRFVWLLLVGIGSSLILKKRPDRAWLIKFVLVISTIVCFLGLLQWFMPSDFLTHFGYDKSIGVKENFFINEDPNYPRAFATFRDPNSFGAYLIIPILLLALKMFDIKAKPKLLYGGILLLHLLVLFLSFSRAAWLGTIIGLGVLAVIANKQKAAAAVKRFWPVLIAGVLLLALATFAVRNTPAFRSIILKADDKNAATELDSDEYHAHFIQEGVEDFADQPLGYGPGTAGIVSIQNEGAVRLTENYYVQIALEVGIVGLAVFIAIWLLVIKFISEQEPEPLTTVLLAAAAAYAVMCLVMHLWTNEAVALTWWGLAGLVIYRGNSHNKRVKQS